LDRPFSLPSVARALAVIATASCASVTQRSPAASLPPPAQTDAATGAPGKQGAYTPADVYFMSGMIGHHAQAVLMAGWAPSHGASEAVRALCERIVVGQRDEIVLMQRWLRERHEPVPEADASHDMMPGMRHAMMPGMLTAEQLAELDRARGADFDRLFLSFMIRHHQGAIVMVNQLFGSPGGGEQETVFRFASDVYADQTTEIDRMQKLLVVLITGNQP
jgi:uncharacterized protein (DUF305 family)